MAVKLFFAADFNIDIYLPGIVEYKCVFKKSGFQYREDGMKLEME